MPKVAISFLSDIIKQKTTEQKAPTVNTNVLGFIKQIVNPLIKEENNKTVVEKITKE